MQKFFVLLLLFICPFLFGQSQHIKLPKNFTASIFSKDMPKVRALAFSDSGILYASSGEGNIYRIDASGVSKLIVQGLKNSIGLVFYKESLIVSSIDTLYQVKNPETIQDPIGVSDLTVLYNQLPKETWHGGRYLSIMGNTLVVNIGVPCNICQEANPMFGNIIGFDLTKMPFSSYSFIARGVRNSVGQDVDPVSQKLFFSDNGQDNLGEDFPFEEINRVDKVGDHFGFPYFANTKKNKEYPLPDKLMTKPPVFLLPPHSAPLGIHFYRGNLFPKQYRHNLFVALHGSWVRKKNAKSGYQVVAISFDNKRKPVKSSIFLQGLLKNNQSLGRPVDIKEDKLGNLYISDDLNGVIYKVTYTQPK